MMGVIITDNKYFCFAAAIFNLIFEKNTLNAVGVIYLRQMIEV